MTADANVTNKEAPGDALEGEPAAPVAAEPATNEPSAEKPRSWSMPKSRVTREQADQLGRTATKVATAIGRAIAGMARFGARALRRLWRMAEAVPPAVQGFAVAAILMLLGVVGAIALRNTVGLICTVVVIPVCASILGALGHRWYSGLGLEVRPGADTQPAEPVASDLHRSVEYVDKKLALALTSFGTDHHQQAVIALFQAKTAVELTLGTEQDTATYPDLPLRADDYGLRPRIRAGTGSTSALREGNSSAAS